MDAFKKSLDFVKSILTKYPQTRGDDMELIIKSWEDQGVSFTESQKRIIRKCYSPETLTRCRRKIQETGQLRPAKPIEDKRLFLETEYRKEFKQQKYIFEDGVCKTI